MLEKKREKRDREMQGGYIVKKKKKKVELFTMIMVMQEDELENTVKENPLAEKLSPLNSHP